MTLNELMADVLQLGFESYIENEEAFIYASNRALSLIYVDRPVSDIAKITFSGPRVTVAKNFIEHGSDESITIPIKGKCLSFRSTGNGMCVLTDVRGSTKIPLVMPDQLTKQFIHGDATVTFSGSYYFTVSNLAVFADTVSNNQSDIPEYKPYVEICPEDYCRGFRAFASLPTDAQGRTVESIRLEDGKLRAPFDYRGELYLTYYRAPAPITNEDYDARIDVSDECAPLLPILTASFMWLDDDAGKAQYYMSLYRDLAANIKRYSTRKIDTVYSVNGWA